MTLEDGRALLEVAMGPHVAVATMWLRTDAPSLEMH
jgi:hypothetical protein